MMLLEDFGNPQDKRRTRPDPVDADDTRETELAAAIEAAALAEARARAAEDALRRADGRTRELAEALAAARAQMEARYEKLVVDWTAAFREAAASCLASLAATGFPEEAAAAVEGILRRADLPRPRLRVSPALAAMLDDRLDKGDSPLGISHEQDPDLPDGMIDIAWDEGGARLSLEDMEAVAIEALERHLRSTRMRRSKG